jgi:hypothetical protein
LVKYLSHFVVVGIEFPFALLLLAVPLATTVPAVPLMRQRACVRRRRVPGGLLAGASQFDAVAGVLLALVVLEDGARAGDVVAVTGVLVGTVRRNRVVGTGVDPDAVRQFFESLLLVTVFELTSTSTPLFLLPVIVMPDTLLPLLVEAKCTPAPAFGPMVPAFNVLFLLQISMPTAAARWWRRC